jgi:small membrane protein
MLIQILLIASVVVLLLLFLRHHGKSKTAASVKIGFSVFMLFGVLAVLLPGEVAAIANFLGVGRGTDLLLYGLIVAFGFATINTFLRFKELELRYAKLVRAMAIQNAKAPDEEIKPTDTSVV